MSKQINRAVLLVQLNLVKAAISKQEYIPLLTHFMFDGKAVTAYNDITAISTPCDADFQGCVPSELLIKTLKSMSAELITMERFSEHVLISAGKSKIKIPALPSKDFPSPFYKLQEPLYLFYVNGDMRRGIKLCLIGVGNNQAHPSEVGITLDPDYSDTEAAIYSTDNVTLSRFVFNTDSDHFSPIILPTFFCEQLLALSTGSNDAVIEVHDGALVADFGGGSLLFTKMIDDVQPKAFEDVINRYIENGYLPTHGIPDLFNQGFERAMLIQETEAVRDTEVNVEDGKLTLLSSSKTGEAFDTMLYDGDDIKFHIDPTSVKRISFVTSKIALLPKVMVFTDDDEDFIHLIAHHSV